MQYLRNKKPNTHLDEAFDCFPCSHLRFYKWESLKWKKPRNNET